MPRKRKLTDPEVARTAYHTLKDEGVLPPTTEEEVAALEDEFGVYPKSKMSAREALNIAKGLSPKPEIAPPAAFAELRGKIKEELGLAARKGEEIPPEVWEKMKADRRKARNE